MSALDAIPVAAAPAQVASTDTAQAVPVRRLSVGIVNPKFEPSYWGFDYALPHMAGDKRCWVVTGALPALASLAPAHCDVVLFDENVEALDFDRLRQFDVVGVTGMIVQRERMLEILERLRGGRATVVAGGPYVSVAADSFEGRCDAMFIGEAEQTWPEFLTAFALGQALRPRYEQAGRTDMQRVPAPRYDLVRTDRYMMASLQFSRGCPFLCEFCDIITIFGRKPRLKTPAQMLAEFDAVLAAGFRSCFLVDDNFIGNKAKAKELLVALVDWQRRHGFPLALVTEASINLADDAELLELMAAANFRQVFIGIETPSMASLVETRKVQNTRGDGLLDKIQRIRDSGLVVQAGFIVGFDSDTDSIFDEQYAFIQASGISQALVAILSPIPTTPLHRRLQAEGRLDSGDPDVAFVPKQMSRETLKAGFERLMRRLYAPEAYFGRLFDGYAGSPAFRRRRAARRTPTGRWHRAVAWLAGFRQACSLAAALRRDRKLWALGSAYATVWWRRNRPLGASAMGLAEFVGLCVVHWHFFRFSRLPRRSGFGTVLDLLHGPDAATK
jgi:radical SAM superfamily enzyme YgiQ (UPF0313 family)